MVKFWQALRQKSPWVAEGEEKVRESQGLVDQKRRIVTRIFVLGQALEQDFRRLPGVVSRTLPALTQAGSQAEYLLLSRLATPRVLPYLDYETVLRDDILERFGLRRQSAE